MPECEDITVNSRQLEFNQPWLNFTIPPDPATDKSVHSCVRYAPISNGAGQCTADSFDTQQTIECTEFVYATDEQNIQTEVCSLEKKIKFIFISIVNKCHWNTIIFSSTYIVWIAINWRWLAPSIVLVGLLYCPLSDYCRIGRLESNLHLDYHTVWMCLGCNFRRTVQF